MKRLASAIWNDSGPFMNLNGVADCRAVRNPGELTPDDILIVHGGEDIHPSLYNKAVSRYTGVSGDNPSQRDRIEWALMQEAVKMGVPIIGICRGAQMLCALAGGFLVQHVHNHGGRHMVVTKDDHSFLTNSIHHQMMYPFDVEHELVSWVPEKLSDVHYDVDQQIELPLEPEFVFFPQQKGFAIQWHPEMMADNTPANQYVIKFINERLA